MLCLYLFFPRLKCWGKPHVWDVDERCINCGKSLWKDIKEKGW